MATESATTVFHDEDVVAIIEDIDGFDPRVRPWYKSGKNTGESIWTDLYVDAHTKKLTVTAASPVYGNAGAFIGVVGFDVLLETPIQGLNAIVSRMVKGESGIALFEDNPGNQQYLAFAPIRTVGASLRVLVQRSEILLPVQESGKLIVIIIVLIIRDLIYLLFPYTLVFPIFDLFVLSLYMVFLTLYTGFRLGEVVFLIINGAAVLFGVIEIFYSLIPEWEFVFNILAAVNIIYLAIAYGLVSPYNTQNAAIIIRIKFVLVAGLFLSNLIAPLYGYENRYVQSVLIPLSYLIHAYVLLRYFHYIVGDKERSIHLYSSNLDSMFDFMENLGNAITAKIDLPKVFDIIISSAVRNINADSGAILLVDEYEDYLKVQATYGIYPPLKQVPDIVRVNPTKLKSYFIQQPIALGETVLGECVQNGQALFIRDTKNDERLQENSKDDILFLSSLIVIPLIVGNRVLGVVTTIKRAEEQFFEERDFTHLKTFADFASITIDNLDREVNIAAEIQQKLLPRFVPDIHNVDLALLNRPAKGISGDYYDIFPLNQNRIGFAICDVAGKGVPAALVMVMIRSILHLIVTQERDAATILRWLNKGITGRIDIDHFATMGFLIYEPNDRRFRYSNAGHVPVLVFKKATGKLHKVDAKGLPIGVERDTQFEQKVFKAEDGDMLILYTDGILDCINEKGEQYSISRLHDVIASNSDLSAGKIAEKLKQDLARFTGSAKQQDDQTLLILKVQ